MKIFKLNNNYNACKKYGYEMGVTFPSSDSYQSVKNFIKLADEMFGADGSTIKSRTAHRTARYQWHITENDMWARDWFNKKPQVFYFKASALTMLLLRWQNENV